jgi:hypothetical protein
MPSRRGFTSSSGCSRQYSTFSDSSPFSRDRRWYKGLVYSLLVWLTNAFIVLPRIGEGSAGSRYLSAAGMTYFAAAHTAFLGLLALLYARFMR